MALLSLIISFGASISLTILLSMYGHILLAIILYFPVTMTIYLICIIAESCIKKKLGIEDDSPGDGDTGPYERAEHLEHLRSQARSRGAIMFSDEEGRIYLTKD